MKRRCLSKRFFGTIDTKTEGEVRMMKTIAVVAVHKDFAEFIKADLEKYFSSYAKIRAYAEEEIDSIDVYKRQAIYSCGR